MAQGQAQYGATQMRIAIRRAVAHEVVEHEQAAALGRQAGGFGDQGLGAGGVELEDLPGQPCQHRTGGDLPALHQPQPVHQGVRIGSPEAGDGPVGVEMEQVDRGGAADDKQVARIDGVGAEDADMRVDATLRHHRPLAA